MTLREFEKIFGDPSGEWKKKKDCFWRIDWDAFSNNERTWLSQEFLSVHPDPYVRSGGCDPLSRWNEWKKMLALLDDPSERVRWSAALRAGRLPSNQQIKVKLHSIISDIASTDSLTQVAIESYLEQAPAELANSFMLSLARSDSREAVRKNAIRGLIANNAKEELGSLRNLLYEPPDLTWAVHTALIEGCTELGIPLAGLDHLKHADDVYLQRVLAVAKDQVG